MPPWLAKLRSQPLWLRMALLTGVSVAYGLLIVPAAWLIGGSPAILAAIVGGVLCLIGALGALVISDLCYSLPSPHGLLAGVMLATGIRFGIPLGLGMAIQLSRGALGSAGLLYYLALFYPVTLVIETVLTLPETQRPAKPPRS